MNCKRGQIRNRNHVDTKDFSGLLIGNITPTDIDGFIEYQDRAFIFIEAKRNGAKMPYGQRLAYERLLRCIPLEKPSILFVAEYEKLNEENAADMAEAIVTECFSDGFWKIPDIRKTLRMSISEWFSEKLNCHISSNPIMDEW